MQQSVTAVEKERLPAECIVYTPQQGRSTVRVPLAPNSIIEGKKCERLPDGHTDPTDTGFSRVDPTALTGGRVDPASLSGGRVAPGALTDGRVAPSALTDGRVASGALTGGRVAASTLTDGQVASSALTGGAGASASTKNREANLVNRFLAHYEVQKKNPGAVTDLADAKVPRMLSAGELTSLSNPYFVPPFSHLLTLVR